MVGIPRAEVIELAVNFKLTLSKIGIFMIALSFLPQLILLMQYSRMLDYEVFLAHKEWHTKELTAHLNFVVGCLASASLCSAQYAITRDKDYRTAYNTALDSIKKEPPVLLGLLQGDINQDKFIHQLLDEINQLLGKLEPIVTTFEDDGQGKAFDLLSDKGLKDLFRQIVVTRAQIVESEHWLFRVGTEALPTSRAQMKNLVNAGMIIDILLAFSLMIAFSRHITRRLEVMTDNSSRLAAGRQLNVPVSGNDEIAMLDQRFHHMADALNEAARKERALVDNARDLICTIDANGIFLRVNPAAQAILGRDPDEMRGQHYLDFVSTDDRTRVSTMFKNLMDGNPSDPIECGMQKKDGSPVDMLLSAHWSGSDKTLFCVMHDITQRRQMERMKRQFIAMITHDLRSPLNAIGNSLDLIALKVYDADSEKGQQGIHAAKLNVNRMLRLISELLEMEKFDATALKLELTKISLSSIVEEAIDSVRAYAEQQNIRIESKSLELEIEADKLRLIQVLVNLLANAIKFSPPTSCIFVSCRLDLPFVTIEVTDSGPGISEADRQLIFEPYKQAKQLAGEQRLEGTGLGLTICKSLVEAHHGSVGVIPAQPRGSTFWIKLPLVQPKQIT